VSLAGRVVSSTRIREAIRAGRLEAASQMLGRPYTISGRVLKGDRVGRQLGFPTANLDVKGLLLPPNGVYAGMTKVRRKEYRVALNIGFRPTMAPEARRLCVEAHLLEFDNNLYGEELTIEIGVKLRGEKKFASSTELRRQIKRDIAALRTLG
jgi:riboflavin kinase/FMN adenylyltransferase